MIAFETPKGKITFPSSWPEVSYAQYCELSQGVTGADALNILADNSDALLALPMASIGEILKNLPFLKKPFNARRLPIAERIEIEDKVYTLPKLYRDSFTVVQLLRIEQLTGHVSGQTDDLSDMLTVFAIIFYPLFTDEPLRTLDQARQVAKRLEVLPCTILMPLVMHYIGVWQNHDKLKCQYKRKELPAGQYYAVTLIQNKPATAWELVKSLTKSLISKSARAELGLAYRSWRSRPAAV